MAWKKFTDLGFLGCDVLTTPALLTSQDHRGDSQMPHGINDQEWV